MKTTRWWKLAMSSVFDLASSEAHSHIPLTFLETVTTWPEMQTDKKEVHGPHGHCPGLSEGTKHCFHGSPTSLRQYNICTFCTELLKKKKKLTTSIQVSSIEYDV